MAALRPRNSLNLIGDTCAPEPSWGRSPQAAAHFSSAAALQQAALAAHHHERAGHLHVPREQRAAARGPRALRLRHPRRPALPRPLPRRLRLLRRLRVDDVRGQHRRRVGQGRRRRVLDASGPARPGRVPGPLHGQLHRDRLLDSAAPGHVRAAGQLRAGGEGGAAEGRGEGRAGPPAAGAAGPPGGGPRQPGERPQGRRAGLAAGPVPGRPAQPAHRVPRQVQGRGGPLPADPGRLQGAGRGPGGHAVVYGDA
mmetsp:Transcript_2525/g.5317  ORF Transcript_2525/g.5317 Transcript_2525/m.5317 type:complete len:254 (-) Transcript_2525:273-1034(-)